MKIRTNHIVSFILLIGLAMAACKKSTITVTTQAGNGTGGFADGSDSLAQFNYPSGVAIDGDGDIVVADGSNRCIRRITPSGEASTLIDNGTWGVADGTNSAARFNFPSGVVVDSEGNIIVAEGHQLEIWHHPDGDNFGVRSSYRSGNNNIRRITPSGEVSTLAGSGQRGFSDGPGSEAQFNNPSGVAVDGEGNIIVADRTNHRIRKILVD